MYFLFCPAIEVSILKYTNKTDFIFRTKTPVLNTFIIAAFYLWVLISAYIVFISDLFDFTAIFLSFILLLVIGTLGCLMLGFIFQKNIRAKRLTIDKKSKRLVVLDDGIDLLLSKITSIKIIEEVTDIEKPAYKIAFYSGKTVKVLNTVFFSKSTAEQSINLLKHDLAS